MGAGRYFTADQTPLRLPPPSSLMSGPSNVRDSPAHTLIPTTTTTATPSAPAPPHPPPVHANVKPAHGYHDYQTPSPSQQSSPLLPTRMGQPLHHVAALAHQRRNTVQDLARVSPTLSTTASERSAEDFQDARAVQGHAPSLQRIHQQQPPQQRHQSPLPLSLHHHQPYRHHPPPRHRRRLSVEDQHHYADMHPHARLPPAYPQYTPAKQPLSPSSRQTWSPRSEPKSSQVRIADLLTKNEEPRPRPQSSSAASSSSVVPGAALPRKPMGPPTEYRLHMRQQPAAARSCGFGERDRRVIDPPPIIQLTIDDPSLSREQISQKLRYPFAVMHCMILDETGQYDCSAMPAEYRQQRRLMGTLVASPFVGDDENGEEGCFFCFPDLSCRTPGAFRVQFSLVIIDPIASTQPGKRFPVVAEVVTDVFTVYNAKDFPGMQASTPLTKRLKEQGCLISIKKGNDKAHARDESEDEEGNSGSRKKKKAKR